MNNKQLIIGLCVIGLSSCFRYSDEEYVNYSPYPDNSFSSMSYHYPTSARVETYRSSKEVVVPESYHVGVLHAPLPSKDLDNNWVNKQKPEGYTIEIADDEQATVVAQKLYKTPKNDRMAQVRYQKNGKDYYKGVYGSYENAEAAQKALDALPLEIRKNAGVKNWKNVQGELY